MFDGWLVGSDVTTAAVGVFDGWLVGFCLCTGDIQVVRDKCNRYEYQKVDK